LEAPPKMLRSTAVLRSNRRPPMRVKFSQCWAFFLVLLPLLAACPGSVGIQDADGGACTRLPPVCGNTTQACCNAATVCAEQVCQGVRYTCMAGAAGTYTWSDQAVFCDDGDGCTEGDRCTGGYCAGTPKVCNAPPPTTCADGKTLKTFASQGTCTAGTCNYAPKSTPCGQSCVAGKCEGQPCVGLKCDSPPGKCYKNPGTCVAGKCNYAQLAVGSACATSDPCSVGGICDEQELYGRPCFGRKMCRWSMPGLRL